MRTLRLICCLSATLYAAQASAVLEAVIVSNSRAEHSKLNTPAVISVVTRQEIEASGAVHITQVLRGIGGIQLADTYGDGSRVSISMRGFGETSHSNTLVLVDGRRLNNTDIASPDLNSIDLQNVERIEVVQGSAGVLFGDQAVGGVINIITRNPDQARTSVSVAAGSYGNTRLHASTTQSLDDALAYSLSANLRKADNYRDHNEARYANVSGSLSLQRDTGRVFAELQLIDDELQTPGSLFGNEVVADRTQVNAAFAGDFSNLETIVLRAGVEEDVSDDWRFSGELSNRISDGVFRLSFVSIGPETENAFQDRRVLQLTPRFSGFVAALNNAAVTLGSDITQSRYRLSSRLGAQANDQDIASVYAQAVIPVGSDVDVTTGLRHARVKNDITDGITFNNDSIDDSQTAVTLGVAYRVSGDTRLLLRADQNYRFAKVDEYTNATPFTSSSTVILKTQTGVSIEAGVEWDGDSSRGRAMLYRLDLEDEIAFDPATFVNLNLDESVRKGLILENRVEIDPGRAIFINYSFTDAVFTDSVLGGNDVPYVAKHSGRIGLDVAIADSWQLFAEVQAVSDRVLSGDFTNSLMRLPGYGVTNLRLQYASGDMTISARIDNLLDRQYSEFGVSAFTPSFTTAEAYFPSPERLFMLQAGWRFE